MANFDDLTNDIATEFDLGGEAQRLVQEVLGLIASEPRGLSGFVEKFKAAGLEAEAKSWLGGRANMPLSVHQIKKALGGDLVKKIADDLDVPPSYAAMVLGYAVPKFVARLAPGPAMPAVPADLPAAASSAPGPLRSPAPPSAGTEPVGRRLVLPGAALVITLGLFGYAVVTGTAGNPPRIHSASQLAETAPQPPPEVKAVASAPEPASKPMGDFAPAAGWIKNLAAEFTNAGGDAAQMVTAAAGFDPKATMPRAEGPETIGSVPSAELPEFAVAALTGSGPAGIGTNLSPTLALAQPASEQSAASVEAGLQARSIEFPAHSARIPSRDQPIVRQAADMLKQLPAGTVVELRGYPDPAGRPAANKKLAERRARSVYRALVRAGVSPAMLKAKGSPTLLASEGLAAEGRSTAVEAPEHNARHVEFRVVQQQH